MDNIGVIKIRERTSNIYLQFYHTENITGNGWERDDLIRPLLIKVIGHSASQECNWPIAVNLLSLSLLLSPKLLIYCWASFPNDTREEFSLVPNKELIISNCSRIGFLDKHSQFVLLCHTLQYYWPHCLCCTAMLCKLFRWSTASLAFDKYYNW